MIDLGRSFSYGLRGGDTVQLSGELGAGKTTFVRGVLRGLGHTGPVVSPTYTLVETYRTSEFILHHFDLYRLENEQELEMIGYRDYFSGDSVVIIEWPQRALEILPAPDYDIAIETAGSGRCLSIHPR